jgi:hypothetical protein
MENHHLGLHGLGHLDGLLKYSLAQLRPIHCHQNPAEHIGFLQMANSGAQGRSSVTSGLTSDPFSLDSKLPSALPHLSVL